MRRSDRARWSVKRWSSVVVTAIAALGTVGCGGSPTADNEGEQRATPAASSQVQMTSPETSTQTPEAVVSEFLDGVRRGGTTADIGRLMTAKSREQYAAVGLVMQPLGAPDATFEVTRSVPYGEQGMLVHSLWTEQSDSGENTTYEVAWALKKEPEGWRVNGLILDEATVFNFESREDVLAIKQMQEGDGSQADSAPRTAEGADFSMPPLR